LDHDVPVWIERGQEGANRGGFTRADIAGDQADAAFLDDEVEASHEFLKAWGGQHIRCGNGLGKGGGFEAEELLIHDLGLRGRVECVEIREPNGADLFAERGFVFVAQTSQKVGVGGGVCAQSGQNELRDVEMKLAFVVHNRDRREWLAVAIHIEFGEIKRIEA
jgi:hypothetical protein